MPKGIYKRTELNTKSLFKRGHKGYLKEHKEETKIKISNNHTRYWQGKKMSEEHKEKLSKSHKGCIMSEEHKEKISKSLKGHGGYWKGKKLSKTHILKIKNGMNRHHIDLNNKNNIETNILMLTRSKHRQIHSRAYDYLVELDLQDEYIEWFKKIYKIDIISVKPPKPDIVTEG